MKTVIVSALLPEPLKKALSTEGFYVIEGSFSTIIDSETAYHPDMLYFKMPSGKLLVSDKINVVHSLDTFLWVEKTTTPQGAMYPKDCVLNCFTAKNHLICGGYVAEEILSECKQYGLDIIKVRQGYAACSTVKVTDEAFITADISICKALTSHGYKTLLVSNNEIKLNGYNNGFIGGCSLVTEEKIYFTGNIQKHRDFKAINYFCNDNGKKIISLSDGDLYDYGGFITL